MATISYRIETRRDQVFEGQFDTEIDISSLTELGKLRYPKTNNESLVWDKLTREIREVVEKNNPDFSRGDIEKEVFGLINPADFKLFSDEKVKEFEALFNSTSINNPKQSGKWMIWEKITPKTLNNTIAKAKAAGFKSAFWRDDKVGVLLEDLQ